MKLPITHFFFTFLAHGGGKCYVPDDKVNPLQLESRPGLFDSPTTPPSSSMNNSTETEVTEGGTRRRRRELRVRSERVFDSEGRAHNVVNMVSSFFGLFKG